MIDAYYVGSFGDLGNADWFNLITGNQIKDVTGISNVKVGTTGSVTLTIELDEGSLDCTVVRQPGTIKYVGYDQRKTLYEIKMEKLCDNQSTSYLMEIIPHEDDGYGFRRPNRSKMFALSQTIDDYILARHPDPDQLAVEVVRELGRRMGVSLVNDMLITQPIDNTHPPYKFEEAYADLDPSEWISGGIEPIDDERTEGDDLLDFFKSSNGS